MPNPLINMMERLKPGMPRILAYWQRELVGIAQDYWKDGDGQPLARVPTMDDGPAVAQAATPSSAPSIAQPKENLWHALPGEVSEKMWGNGFVTPGDEEITTLLITPLGATKDMGILDLSAGLGGRLRKASAEYGIYITGMEPDKEVAARGQAMSAASGMAKKASIDYYDPMNLKVSRKYDCILARETIYRVADKEKFIQSIVACCKPKAQISFTDYIVNTEMRDQPAIAAWREIERGADPCSLIDMAGMWGKAGISIRVHDDQTEFYKKTVKNGLITLTKFLASGVKPDEETRQAIAKRISLWANRMAAMEQGMRFYRFYGMR